MNHFVVQVFRCGEWRNVTTVPLDRAHSRNDASTKRRCAYLVAMQQLASWRGYFIEPLRIAEPIGRGEYREART